MKVKPHLTVAITRCLALVLAAIAVALARRGIGEDTESAFRLSENAGALTVCEGDRPVLAYNFDIQKKAGVPDDRARSCYVHPLYGLDGECLTDDFPMDHYHHRGLFWAWPHVRIGEQEYDLWMLRGIRHQFERWTERTAGKKSATLAGENGWYVANRKVLGEEFCLVIHSATTAGRRIDVELRLTATAQPVTLWGAAGKSYGGMSLRFAPREETMITTATGRQSTDLNLTRMSWADLSGRFEGAPAPSGVSLFVESDHDDYPPMWITRHYGFLGVGWPGEKPLTLEPDKTMTCRYALWIHRGVPDVAELESMHRANLALHARERQEQLFSQAASYGRQAQEAFTRCRRYAAGWPTPIRKRVSFRGISRASATCGTAGMRRPTIIRSWCLRPRSPTASSSKAGCAICSPLKLL